MLYFSHEGHLQGVMFFSAIKNKGTKTYTLYFIDLVSFGKKRMICTIAKTLNVFGNLFLPSLSQHVFNSVSLIGSNNVLFYVYYENQLVKKQWYEVEVYVNISQM